MKKTSVIFLLILCVAITLTSTGCAASDTIKNIYGVISNLDLDFDFINSNDENNQIDLYLNSETNKKLSDLIDSGASSVSIENDGIAEIQDGLLIPKLQGETYIHCKYGIQTKRYKIVVHNGAENVTSCSISGFSDGAFSAYIGQTYQLTTTNTSSCPISELKIDTFAIDSSMDASEFISVTQNGEIRVVGIGTCEIWVHSTTNTSDEGARVTLSSSFADEKMASAVSGWLSKNTPTNQLDVITRTTLAEIDALNLYELTELNEAEWSVALPSLEQIIIDMKDVTEYKSEYKIGSGEFAYRFIGNENAEYNFSITSAPRKQLNLIFTDFRLNSQSDDALDVSSVENATITCDGVCIIKGADAHDRIDGYNGITANNLTIILAPNASANIIGGDGASIGGYAASAGGVGVCTYGDLEISTVSSHTATLSIYGGKGGNGYDLGSDGGNGNNGIVANSLSASGNLVCSVHGGDGGNGNRGANGNNGANGAKGNNESEGKHYIYGYNGRPGSNGGAGHDGGDGGNGGHAIILAGSCTVSSEVVMHLTSGNGGNGGDGGNGGKGGNGGDGGDDDKWSFAWIEDMSGGSGGKGGVGGAPGSKGKGGHSTSPVIIANEEATLELINVSEIIGQDGLDGTNGRAGADGNNGKHGYAGAGG